MREAAVYDLVGWLNNSKPRPGKTEWIGFPGFHLKAYLRHTLRAVSNSRFIVTLDIASVEVDGDSRSQGYFKSWLDCVERIADECNVTIYMESVLEPRLLKFLTLMGYQRVRDSIPPSYYRANNTTA